jgi:hypothetical protein
MQKLPMLVTMLASAANHCGCDPAAGRGDAAAESIRLPPRNGKLDYQLGGAYPPPTGVTIVARDRSAMPVPGIYNICYVNGFQIQPGEASTWTSQHPDLILRDRDGQPVIDTVWNEMLIDISTPGKRTAVAAVVGSWISGCKASGFDAVDIDNLDSYARSGGLLADADAVAAMSLFSRAAHGAGLAVAQKNTTELVARKADLGTDFAIAEECNRNAECDAYRAGYGEHVLVIEYRRQDFTAGCAAYPSLSIVLRDLALVTPKQAGYVYDGC